MKVPEGFEDSFESGGSGDGMDDGQSDEVTPGMMVDEAGMLAMEGDFEAAFELASAAAQAAEEGEVDQDVAGGAIEIAAFSAVEMGADELALEQIGKLRERGLFNEANYHEARLRFFRWDLEEAAKLAGAIPADCDSAGGATYLMAMLAEYDGRYDAAEELYARAASIDPEGFPAPMRLTEQEVNETLHEAIDSLPPELKEAVGNTVIEVVDLPDTIIDATADMHPMMLGVFEGQDIGGESVFDPGGLPPRARIFKRNLERACTTREDAIEELTRTIYHEIGHRFGFDEDGLEDMDLD